MLHHMNRADRQQRLYDFLKSLGLYVWGVSMPGEQDSIDGEINYICVSVGNPKEENLRVGFGLPFPISSPEEGSEIGKNIAAAIALEPNLTYSRRSIVEAGDRSN